MTNVRHSFPSLQAEEAMKRAIQVDWDVEAGDTGFRLVHLTVPHPEPTDSVKYTAVLLLDYGVENGQSLGCSLHTWVKGSDEAWKKIFQD